MVDERFNVIVGMQFQPGQSVQQATAVADQIRDVFRRIQSAPVQILTPQAMNQFGADLKRQVQSAFSQDLRNSPVFQSLRSIDRGAVRTAANTAPSPSLFAAEAIRVARAELNQQSVQRKSALPLGSDGGFANKYDRTQAELGAAQQLESATRGLAKARISHIVAIGKQIAQEAGDARRSQDAQGRETVAINRRTAVANEATAKQAALTAQQQAADAALRNPVSYPNAVSGSTVGRAQLGVNNAERSLVIANENLAAVRLSEARTSQQVLAAQSAVANASRTLAAAEERLAQQQVRANPIIPVKQGFGAQFAQGFKGVGDRGYAEQIGQAFKFSVFYGTAYKLLFGITQTFAATLQEGIQFQQAVTELKLAAGRTGNEIDELAVTLGKRATEVGFAPSQGVLTGARAIGLYGATNSDAATQAQVADISARTVSRIALSSGQQPADLQNNIAAIVQAFDLGFQGQSRVADLDAYMAQKFGIAPGASIQAVSESATVGRAAGFSQEEVSAIASSLINRTGQTPAAVAGFMAQIFSRGGEGSVANVVSKYGIDPTLTLADQVKELADVYKEDPTSRSGISAAFGRGKVQNAAISLLQDYDNVRAVANAAKTEANGAGDRAVDLRLGNLGGQISITVGALQDFASTLGRTGFLEVIGAGVLVLRELVEATTTLLQVFSELPGPIRAAIAGLVLMNVASRVGGVAGLGGSLGIFRQAGGYGPGAVPGRLGIANAAGVTAPLASRAGLSTLAANAGPALAMAGAIAGLYALGELTSSSQRLAAAQETATEALLTSSGNLVTADDFRSRAAQLTASANDNRDAAGGWAARVIGLGSERRNALDLADRSEAEAKRLNAVAKAKEDATLTADPTKALIQAFDQDALTQSMDLIATSGGTAREQMEALTAALTDVAESGKRATEAFDPKLFAGDKAQGVFEAITGAPERRVLKSEGTLQDAARILPVVGSYIPGSDPKYKDITASLIEKALSQGDVQARIQDAMEKISSLGEIDEKTARELAIKIVGDAADALGSDAGLGGTLNAAEVEGARQDMVNNVAQFLEDQARGTRILLDGVRLTSVELDAIVGVAIEKTQAIVEALPETDFSGRISAARALVQTIRAAIDRTDGDATPQALAALQQAENDLAVGQFNNLENLRRVAQQNASSRAEVAQIGRGFLRKEIAAAVKGGNQDLLVQIIGQAGDGAVQIARNAVNQALRTARQALAIQRAVASAARAMNSAINSFFGSDFKIPGADPSEVNRLKKLQEALNNVTTSGGGAGDVYTTGSDVPGYKAPDSAKDLAAAAKARRDAALEFRSNMRLLSIDITDPVAEAAAALAAARDKLRTQLGDGKDVTSANKVDVRRAQAELEATKFSQRLQAIQTAEELGRVSHLKYISYLENESRRLNAIKNRTFQQQGELDQIDQLLKTAAETMQGQWNFGDINLPTPYQVRRYVEETARSPMAEYSANPLAGTRIYIDGADVGMVKKILADYVGEAPRTTSTYPRKR